jgi:maltose alpha-D-glucosyltransferase/alpha-amylase
VLVVANLSRFVQYAELDLSAFPGHVPVELFGRNPFPPIGKQPYLLTVGPHSFYWFALRAPPSEVTVEPEMELPVLSLLGDWQTVFHPPQRSRLEQVLPAYLRGRRWFAGKHRIHKAVAIREAFRLEYAQGVAYITLVEVEYNEGGPETYLVPLTFAAGERGHGILKEMPHLGVARIQGASDGVLHDALGDPAFCTAILEAMQAGKRYSVAGGEVAVSAFAGLEEARGPADVPLPPSISKPDQRHTSILYGNRLILKIFRRVEPGLNPELEIGRLLTHKGWAHVPAVVGAVEYRHRKGPLMTLGVLQAYVTNVADAWTHTQDTLSSYFEKALAVGADGAPTHSSGAPWHVVYDEPPERAREMIGGYLEQAQLLGKRTAELHKLLAGETGNIAFAPDAFTLQDQRSLYQTLRNMRGQAFHQLRRRLGHLPDGAQALGRRVLDQEEAILKRLRALLTTKIAAQRIRCHGDYHLRQALYTGKDFVLIDLEGDPTRPMSERMMKRTPLRDVAGMVRSFHAAVYSLLLGEVGLRGLPIGVIRPEDVATLEPWAYSWYAWVSAAFLRAYLQEAKQAAFLPPTASQFNLLLETCILEKSFNELGFALSQRPSWARIPLLSILEVLNSADPSDSV